MEWIKTIDGELMCLQTGISIRLVDLDPAEIWAKKQWAVVILSQSGSLTCCTDTLSVCRDYIDNLINGLIKADHIILEG